MGAHALLFILACCPPAHPTGDDVAWCEAMRWGQPYFCYAVRDPARREDCRENLWREPGRCCEREAR